MAAGKAGGAIAPATKPGHPSRKPGRSKGSAGTPRPPHPSLDAGLWRHAGASAPVQRRRLPLRYTAAGLQRLPGALSLFVRFFDALPRVWRVVRAPCLVLLGALVGFGLPYLWRLDRIVSQSFADLRFDIPSRVYARPLLLVPKQPLSEEALLIELDAARYREESVPIHPGTYKRDHGRFEIATRAFRNADGAWPERHLKLRIDGGRLAELADADSGKPITDAVLDPARIATYYGASQTERKLVRLDEVPPLLTQTLLAVEDRDFMHHHGIDPFGIMRAAWVDLTRGELAQGGSTLTQQLTRNLYLDRGQRITRKINEMLMALLIEARFDKRRILEAYLNEVYLGQQGAQAVHGMAAACEFYFGHELTTVSVPEAALLVGLIQGPSLYDPRRSPERARQRRDLALAAMEDQGLINHLDRLAASKAPLGVTERGAIERSRYPAFLELVRQQLARDYPEARLDAAGFTIHTTLAPSTQALAELAVSEQLAKIEKPKRPLQAAMVVTSARDGAIEALIGSRDPDDTGFNRALATARPIGSLVKPFVYLVALAQPERYSLVTPIED